MLHGRQWRRRLRTDRDGHPAASLACALEVSPGVVWGIVRGTMATVSRDMHAGVSVLNERRWNLRPPERTRADRQAADAPRRQAAARGWPAPMGLDDERIDDPAYRPHAYWRRAHGTGTTRPARAPDTPQGRNRRRNSDQGPDLEEVS
jgi:hypothetical protein